MTLLGVLLLVTSGDNGAFKNEEIAEVCNDAVAKDANVDDDEWLPESIMDYPRRNYVDAHQSQLVVGSSLVGVGYPQSSPYVTSVGATMDVRTSEDPVVAADKAQAGGIMASGGGFPSFTALPLNGRRTLLLGSLRLTLTTSSTAQETRQLAGPVTGRLGAVYLM